MSIQIKGRIIRGKPACYDCPTSSIRGLRVLLVDDITVSGTELDMAKQAMLDSGAKEVKTATLAVYTGGAKPDYFALNTNDLILNHHIKKYDKLSIIILTYS